MIPARPQLGDLPQHPILLHFRPSRSSANDRYGHSESNALIGVEIGEFRKKMKNLEFRQNSSFWKSLDAIWIDSVSFEAFRSVSIFFESWGLAWKDPQAWFPGLEGCIGMVSWLGKDEQDFGDFGVLGEDFGDFGVSGPDFYDFGDLG